MCPIVLYNQVKILGRSLESYWRKGKKSKKIHPFGTQIFFQKLSTTIDESHCLLHLSKTPLEQFWRQDQNGKKTHLFWTLNLNPGLRIFSEKLSGSNDGPYCPLHSCKKLGKSLEPFWRKGRKVKKDTFVTLDPILSRLA